MRGGIVHYNRPLLRWLALSSILTVTLTGCFGSNQSSGLSSSSGGSDQVTIKIWRSFDSNEVFKEIIDDFEQDNPNVKLEYKLIPTDEYELTVSEALAAGNGPDIWSIRNDWVPRHKDKLVPMPEHLLASELSGTTDKGDTDTVEALFAPVVANDVMHDGRAYGLPLYVDTLVVYKNPAIISKTIDELLKAERDDDADFLRENYNTWEDLQRAVRLLTKRNGSNIEQAGIAAGVSSNVSRSEDIVAAMMLQNGTQMLSPEKTNSTFHLPSTGNTGQQTYLGTEALKRFTSFADPNDANYSWNANMPNDVQAFIEGKTAMFFGYQYHQLLLKQTAPLLQYDIMPFPQVRDTATPVDYASYWVEGVTKNANDPDLAWQVVKSLVFTHGGSYRGATGRPAPHFSGDPVTTLDRAEQSDPFSFQQATALSWHKTKRPDRVDTYFRDMIQQVGTKQTSAQNAIEAAAKRVSEQLITDQG